MMISMSAQYLCRCLRARVIRLQTNTQMLSPVLQLYLECKKLTIFICNFIAVDLCSEVENDVLVLM